jgi:leucyl aminopeptidase
LIVVVKKDTSMFEALTQTKSALKSSLSVKALQLVVIFDAGVNAVLWADALGSSLAARLFSLPEMGQRVEKAKDYSLKTVALVGPKAIQKKFDEGFALGNGTNVVRYLGILPPNVLNTTTYKTRIKKICDDFGFHFKFTSNAELKKMGAGAFTAVDQGNPDSDGGIYEITYKPRGAKNKKPVALVGKGLCFDTGGYDIKTGGYMLTMKGDMQGSAIALSSLMTAARLKIPLTMKAFLGVTENHISPKAYTADQVVTALNGVSIEVINTDAEGRMVLADTLCMASRCEPALMMDFATLTGSAVRSIGTRYGAVFTSEDQWHRNLVEAGRTSGERVWTFPMDEDYGEILKSSLADTLQCGKGPGPDHIHAAYFLKKFVGKDIPWVHLDLAAAENNGGLAHTDSTFTGFGVRFAMQFLRQRFKV